MAPSSPAPASPARTLVDLLGGHAALELRYGPCLKTDVQANALTLQYPGEGVHAGEWFRVTVEREHGTARVRRSVLYCITVERSLNGRPYDVDPARERVHVTRGDLAAALAAVDGVAELFSAALVKLTRAEQLYWAAHLAACRALRLPTPGRVENFTANAWEHRPSPLPGRVSDSLIVDAPNPNPSYSDLHWLAPGGPHVRGPYTVWPVIQGFPLGGGVMWVVVKTNLQRETTINAVRPVEPGAAWGPKQLIATLSLSSDPNRVATVSRVGGPPAPPPVPPTRPARTRDRVRKPR